MGKCHRIFRLSRTAANEKRQNDSPTTVRSSFYKRPPEADSPEANLGAFRRMIGLPCRRAIVAKPGAGPGTIAKSAEFSLMVSLSNHVPAPAGHPSTSSATVLLVKWLPGPGQGSRESRF